MYVIFIVNWTVLILQICFKLAEHSCVLPGINSCNLTSKFYRLAFDQRFSSSWAAKNAFISVL